MDRLAMVITSPLLVRRDNEPEECFVPDREAFGANAQAIFT
jgi:hypothetical protein